MDPTKLHWLSAADAARAVRDGAVASEELVAACLARIREADGDIHAWVFLDPEHALAQARILDQMRQAGEVLGPLHGIPVAIKDVIDTTDMPTECGTSLHAGRLPVHDASAVAWLRSAGAVIIGKTTATEHGSAAAVAAGMIPIALGTQTGGEVILPASSRGVYGFKPTHGLIPRSGIQRLSRTLDQVGVFARTLDDVALACEQLVGSDGRDPDTRPRARVPFRELAAADPPLPPLFAWMEPVGWERAQAQLREAFEELLEALADRIVRIPLGDSAGRAVDLHRTILEAELAFNLAADYERGKDTMGASLREQVERGRRIGAVDHQLAVSRIEGINDGFEEIFERCDAVITPCDPACCTLWTLAGMPALAVPLMQGEGGQPIGVQLVGPRNSDARLLRTARWLADKLASD